MKSVNVRGETMTKRGVDSLAVVFNLSIRKALALPQRLTTYVLFRYDKKRSRKEFKILNRGLPFNEMDGDDLSESDAPWQVAEGLPKGTSMLSSQAERGLSGGRLEQIPSFDGF